MSTVPVHGAGFPPAGRIAGSAERWSRRLAGQLLLQARADLRNVPRYLARYFLLLFGLLRHPVSLGGIRRRVDSHADAVARSRSVVPLGAGLFCRADASDSARWQGLVPVLAILDEVNPTAAALWVRQLHQRGALFPSPPTTSLACRKENQGARSLKYDFFPATTWSSIGRSSKRTTAPWRPNSYATSTGTPGRTSPRPLRHALSFMFLDRAGDASIIENDAELYEHEARVAIFGQGEYLANWSPKPTDRERPPLWPEDFRRPAWRFSRDPAASASPCPARPCRMGWSWSPGPVAPVGCSA